LDTISASQWVLGPGGGLPHLVQLELSGVGLPGSSAFLQALARCPSLQQLTLNLGCDEAYEGAHPVDVNVLAGAVSSLTQLRGLHLDFAIADNELEGNSLAGLLPALPPSLEDMQLGVSCYGSIPASCMTHLVNLRAWDTPEVYQVADDSASHFSSSTTTATGTATGTSAAGGFAAMTALTRLSLSFSLEGEDARLKLPSLRAIDLRDAEPEAWQQLQAMGQLQAATVMCFYGYTESTTTIEGLGGMTQLQKLHLRLMDPHVALDPPLLEPWAAAIGRLTGLTSLRLSALLVIGCEPTMLGPLTQLRELTIDLQEQLGPQYSLMGPQLAANPASAVVSMFAGYKVAGLKQLQRLVLIVPGGEAYWQESVKALAAGAKAAWPGVEVEVQWYMGGRLL
jgi:hypothetical protein